MPARGRGGPHVELYRVGVGQLAQRPPGVPGFDGGGEWGGDRPRDQQAPDSFESVVCVSAQHRAMLDQVLSVFGLHADHDLDLMTAGQSPAEVTARVLQHLPPLLRRRTLPPKPRRPSRKGISLSRRW